MIFLSEPTKAVAAASMMNHAGSRFPRKYSKRPFLIPRGVSEAYIYGKFKKTSFRASQTARNPFEHNSFATWAVP